MLCFDLDITRARKIIAKFVEGASHDTVSSVKSLFNAISVVHVNLTIQHARVIPTKANQVGSKQ